MFGKNHFCVSNLALNYARSSGTHLRIKCDRTVYYPHEQESWPIGCSFFFNFLGWGETESTWYVGH
jgi:hypothetical protein